MTPAKQALLILSFINLFNYLDRYVVSALVETLKHSELALNDTQAGFLMTGFVVVYMVACPFFGTLGDRYSRKKLIMTGVLIWSLATALGGFAVGFFSLFCARALVGVGEAAYGTIAPTLIADFFSIERRGRALSVFFAAIPIGSALGYVLGGLVNSHYGWRAAFFIAGIPGLFLAFLTLRIMEPKRGAEDAVLQQLPKTARPKLLESLREYRDLFRSNHQYSATLLGYAAYTFGLGGLAFWMPAFLERVRGLPKEQASIQFGAVVVITGFIGTFVGGWLGDFYLKKHRQAYLWVSGLATLLAVPFALVSLIAPDPALFWSGMIGAQLLLFASTGPINSVVINLVKPYQRAVGVAACNFTIHVFGDVPSPPMIGWISDQTSLQKGILLIPVAIAVSGVIWCFAATLGQKPQVLT